jgi:sugar diacid utilization regulator
VKTLEAGVLSDGNALETSRPAGIHAKTVAYRPERSEIAGIDFADVEEMLTIRPA